MDTLLSVSHVSYSYHTLSGETPALSDITFSVKEGEFLSIVGPSGCGKSTLLSLLASLMEPEYVPAVVLVHQGKHLLCLNPPVSLHMYRVQAAKYR